MRATPVVLTAVIFTWSIFFALFQTCSCGNRGSKSSSSSSGSSQRSSDNYPPPFNPHAPASTQFPTSSSRRNVYSTGAGSSRPARSAARSSSSKPAIRIEKETAQSKQKIDLTFALTQLEGPVIVLVSTKPVPQAVGVEEGTAEGAIKKLKLNSDDGWTQIWASERVMAKEEGVMVPGKCTVDYKFSDSIAVKVQVVDERKEDLIGIHMTYLSDIVSEGQQVVFLSEPDNNGNLVPSNGVLIIGSQENRRGYDDEVAYELVGKNFPKRSSKLPYITISKLVKENGEEKWKPVDKTFMHGFKHPHKPQFWPLSLRISQITQANDSELQLRFVCKLRDYDDPELKHEYLGEFDTTYHELKVGREFSCEPRESKIDNNTNIIIVKSKTTLPTFLEIVPSLDIRASVSIDFTASNRQGRYSNMPFGMHTIHKDGGFNYYEQAILSIIPIVEHYDEDKEMPVMGFGAIDKTTRLTSQCFPLRPMMGPDADGKPRNANCIGTLGVLEAYRYVVRNGLIVLNGPTHYQPSIKLVREQACAHKGDNDAFYLLVILTDGDYSDESETKAEIAMASECPMSIILVGIGDDEFKKLEDLDNDDGIPLQGFDKDGNRHEAVADIVQHVRYKDFLRRRDTPNAMSALKDAVLEEFPTHVQNYFKMYNLRPKPHAGPIRSLNVEPKPITATNMNELARRFGYQDI